MTEPLSAEEISYQSERVTHLCPNDVYYAHLSIYHFALQFCINKSVLDAGSGSGYGAAYLAEHGARKVIAFDVEEKAVEFSRYYFSRPNLNYQVMNIEQITGFSKSDFDVIFSSNALEHVPNVYPFFRSAWELLKPEGRLIIAVPPVVDELSRQANLGNPFHLNIWTPRQWSYILSLYFSDVQSYIHGFDKPGVQLDFDNSPEQTQITEKDFSFSPVTLDEFYSHHTLTVVFVAREPRFEKDVPDQESITKFVDDSFTRSSPDLLEQSQSNVNAKSEILRLITRSWEVVQQDGFKVLFVHLKNYISDKMLQKQ